MKTVEMSDATYTALQAHFDPKVSPDHIMGSVAEMIGCKWFIRTVTYHCVGRVMGIIDADNEHRTLALAEASWVADSGRFMQCIKDGTLSEVEPVGTMYVKMSAMVDFFPWNHALPTEQK